jgi:hypothetical protein
MTTVIARHFLALGDVVNTRHERLLRWNATDDLGGDNRDQRMQQFCSTVLIFSPRQVVRRILPSHHYFR